jgi:hypothetical protein
VADPCLCPTFGERLFTWRLGIELRRFDGGAHRQLPHDGTDNPRVRFDGMSLHFPLTPLPSSPPPPPPPPPPLPPPPPPPPQPQGQRVSKRVVERQRSPVRRGAAGIVDATFTRPEPAMTQASRYFRGAVAVYVNGQLYASSPTLDGFREEAALLVVQVPRERLGGSTESRAE